jgi:zinc/manganese transport system substrate-binding protein
MRSLLLALALALAAGSSARATVRIVAAENFYGDVARQVGGGQVEVTSILTNPDQDPHLFTVDPSTAQAIEQAAIVVSSGIDYDPWMTDLVNAHPNAARRSIVVADLIHAREGDNPHIWYKPETMPAFAARLADLLCASDPSHAADYRARLAAFNAALQPVQARIATLKARFAGTDVLATEPVFGYMAGALGFKMHALDFQDHVMNNVEPTARETEEFETLLQQRQVKILFYNGQASDPIADRMKDVAKTAGIPVIGVTETEPAGTTFASWMLTQLDEVEKALSR